MTTFCKAAEIKRDAVHIDWSVGMVLPHETKVLALRLGLFGVGGKEGGGGGCCWLYAVRLMHAKFSMPRRNGVELLVKPNFLGMLYSNF